MNRKTIWILWMLMVVTAVAPVLAQVSAHFDLTWHVLSGGGGMRQSHHYQIDDVLGQWSGADISTSAHYRIDPGFWHVGVELELNRLYLPMAAGSSAP